MNTEEAYDNWSEQYDSNDNKTRDLEARAFRDALEGMHPENCLEIGCGTGKNTLWLAGHAGQVTAVDLSAAMIARAKKKIQSENVRFVQADLTHEWTFATSTYDWIGFSLVLEHIEDLETVFKKASQVLSPGGYLYAGELHPFKQYTGSKARFETAAGMQVVTCFNHHISDFTQAAAHQRLSVVGIRELFDDDDRTGVPRILSMLFQKNN